MVLAYYILRSKPSFGAISEANMVISASKSSSTSMYMFRYEVSSSDLSVA